MRYIFHFGSGTCSFAVDIRNWLDESSAEIIAQVAATRDMDKDITKFMVSINIQQRRVKHIGLSGDLYLNFMQLCFVLQVN